MEDSDRLGAEGMSSDLRRESGRWSVGSTLESEVAFWEVEVGAAMSLQHRIERAQ